MKFLERIFGKENTNYMTELDDLVKNQYCNKKDSLKDHIKRYLSSKKDEKSWARNLYGPKVDIYDLDEITKRVIQREDFDLDDFKYLMHEYNKNI